MRQSAVLEETLISEWGENKFSEIIEFFLYQMNLRMENQVGGRRHKGLGCSSLVLFNS